MNEVLKAMNRSARTENGAISNVSTLNNLLDYFANAGTYQGRDQSSVNADMGKLFTTDEENALKLVFGLRLVTRKPKDSAGNVLVEDTQTGYGRRDEFAKALVYMHYNRKDLLYSNLHLIPVFGSWKDFLNEPLIDTLDAQKVYELFAANLNDPLLLKFLPTIRNKRRKDGSPKDLTDRDRKRVIWARGLCKHLGISEKEYRKMKAGGAAHIFQRQMSAKQWDKINFNGIPGKAMLNMTSRTGKDKQNLFERHGLVSKLTNWVQKQAGVKFTGYPYELARACRKCSNTLKNMIYDKQAETMIEPMKNHSLGNVLCAIDISSSMQCQIVPNVTAYDICTSMGATFSMLNVGYFKDAVVSFSDRCDLVKLGGGTFSNRIHEIDKKCTGWGSTNFQGVIDMIVNIRKQNPSIPLSEYPETILVVSDMQFNPSGGYSYNAGSNSKAEQTNYETARQKLASVGLPAMRIIWWNVAANSYNSRGVSDFPATMDDKGCYMISGFDPVNLKALMGLTAANKDFNAKVTESQTPLDGMMNFLGQPIFSLLSV